MSSSAPSAATISATVSPASFALSLQSPAWSWPRESICAASSITIGEGTLIGTGVLIFDNDIHRPVGEFGMEDAARETAKPISIGRGCFIGARAIILKGVTIGDRSAVAAGAVVTRNVPPGMVAFGNPATTKPWKAAEAAKRESPRESGSLGCP